MIPATQTRSAVATAKLSRKFYERLGDDIAGELVDWFNAVDTDYQRQYREANDLNWERFKAHMDARIAEVRRELDVRLASTETAIRSDIANTRSELIKWMFVFWTGSFIGLGGLMVALINSL